MKTSISLLIASLLAGVFAINAYAQQEKFEFLVGGGVDSPLAPNNFTNAFHTGWTAKLAGGYFILPQITIGVNLSYNRFPFDNGTFTTPQATEVDGNDLGILEAAGVGKYYFVPMSRKTNYYVLLGPGIANYRTTDFTYKDGAGTEIKTDGQNDTEFMLTGGAGITYRLAGDWRAFVEGRYSYLFTRGDNTTYLPVRVGVIF